MAGGVQLRHCSSSGSLAMLLAMRAPRPAECLSGGQKTANCSPHRGCNSESTWWPSGTPLLLCWQFAIQNIMTDTLGRSRHPKRRGLLRFKDHRAFRFTNSKPSINKKPRPVTGALDPEWMQRSYIFGLHFLAWASQTPPALVQSASVFAFATSAEKAGAVKANASPKPTVTQMSFFIGTSPPETKLPCR